MLSRQEGSTTRHLASAQHWTGLAGGDTGRLFLTFGGPVCADRISYCPLDRVLTYKNLIYLLNLHFIALIHPIQWTIAKPVGADRPAKRQKKTSCVSTGWPVPVLCIRQVAHGIYFLSRQHDVIASFSFGACTVQTCFQHLQIF